MGRIDCTADETVRVLDLFAGAGGFSAGLREASDRFVSAAAVEMNVDAAATYSANFPEADVFHGDIADWLDVRATGSFEVVAGGPPCQGFSALGLRDVEDQRNGLWSAYVEAVRRVRPRYFVLENVPQFLRSSQFAQFSASFQPGGRLENYAYRADVLNAADFGAPQARKRALVIGWRRDQVPPRLLPSTPSGARATVKDAFRGVPRLVDATELPDRMVVTAGGRRPGPFISQELHLGRSYEPLSLQRFAAIPLGGNRFDLPDHLKAPCWRTHTSGSGDVMGRLHWDKPAVTIRTEFFKPEKGRYLHPDQDRAITHFEAARLQGFPDDYLWVGSKTSIARQIGNAVPIALGRAIGEALLAAIASTSGDTGGGGA